MFPGVYCKVSKPFLWFNLDANIFPSVSLVSIAQYHPDQILITVLFSLAAQYPFQGGRLRAEEARGHGVG